MATWQELNDAVQAQYLARREAAARNAFYSTPQNAEAGPSQDFSFNPATAGNFYDQSSFVNPEDGGDAERAGIANRTFTLPGQQGQWIYDPLSKTFTQEQIYDQRGKQHYGLRQNVIGQGGDGNAQSSVRDLGQQDTTDKTWFDKHFDQIVFTVIGAMAGGAFAGAGAGAGAGEAAGAAGFAGEAGGTYAGTALTAGEAAAASGTAGATAGASGAAGTGAAGIGTDVAIAGSAGSAGTAGAATGTAGSAGIAGSGITLGQAAGAVAPIVGGLINANSARNALDAQVATGQQADATQRYFYDTNRADNADFLRNGRAASNALAGGLGIGPATPGGPASGELMRKFTIDDFNADPVNQLAFKFGMDQGVQGINRQASARGGIDSGAILKRLTEHGIGFGNQFAGDSRNRFVADQDTRYNRLAGVSGSGQVASAQVGAAGMNAGNNIAQNQTAVGNARGASAIAQGNALAGGLTGAYDNYQNSQFINALRDRNRAY
jgi:hypothetical protein